MTNRLATEKSPYLLQHAANPVAWFPWGEEAFARARAEDKPIFLSIGYSTCHWCHVMAHESFENPEVAAALNADFVAVKVDREERPDVDHVYMTYVQSVTGHGGWPLSAWLTPDLKPFFGGTYFPPADRGGRPGFTTLLHAIAKGWRDEREKIVAEADRVLAGLRDYALHGEAGATAPAGEALPLGDAATEAFELAFQYFGETFDATHGGFGGAPKFPRPSVLNFLHRVAAGQGPGSALGGEAVRLTAFTLQKMAEGGVHDHVGGGFHRYAVDAEWFVPHFEKMLYDQAQLAVACLEAKQATGRDAYAWLARDIFDYVRRDLTAPAGGFFSAEDADSELPDGRVGRGVPAEPSTAAGGGSAGGFALPADKKPEHAEGAFYVWTKEELVRELGADAEFFCTHYGVREDGNVAPDPQGEFTGKNILRQRQSLTVAARTHGLELADAEARLLAGLEKLRGVRARRPRPQLDDKIITAWNGLMISALAKGAQVLGEPEHLAAAVRAAEFLHRELYDAGRGVLYRSWREGRSHIEGFAEDYAALIQGLLDLYEASFEHRWLEWALQLQAQMDARFWDEAQGGYFNSREDDPDLIVRLKENYDGAEPAPGSLAAMNLLRLDWMLGDGDAPPPGRSARSAVSGAPNRGEGAAAPAISYHDRARRTVESLRVQWTKLAHALPQLLCALELALAAPRTVVLAGDPRRADFRALAAVLHEQLGPRRALLCADGGEGQRWLAQRMPYVAEMKPLGGRATAYVCEDFSCRQPVQDAAALRALLG
ncbi:MAG: thioredoxin domain-containing protein [Opitutae bacterium]|nr:thioredoxin domain-containing protein [Opitutae bacterium]